jgi:hypothetical protein
MKKNMNNDNKDIVVGGSKYDVENIEHYDYLKPIWEILNNIPEKGITSEELFKQTSLDEKQANTLIKNMMTEFQNKFMKELEHPFKMMFKFSKKDFYDKNLGNCWAWDKMMLLATKIDTGQPNPMDNNPFMNKFKQQWIEKRGGI